MVRQDVGVPACFNLIVVFKQIVEIWCRTFQVVYSRLKKVAFSFLLDNQAGERGIIELEGFSLFINLFDKMKSVATKFIERVDEGEHLPSLSFDQSTVLTVALASVHGNYSGNHHRTPRP